MDLQRGDIRAALSDLFIYCTWKNINKFVNNNFKRSETTWDEEFELLDGSFSISNIQDHSEYIIKKHELLSDKPLVQIYVNTIQKRVTFKIKSGAILSS